MPTYPLRVMYSLAACLAVLFAVDTAAAQTSPAPEGQVNAGFALQTSLVAAPVVISGGGLAGVFGGFGSFEGGLFAGYKFDRVIVGAGFDFTTWSENETTTAFDPTTMMDITVDRTERSFSFVVYPEVQVAFVRSADARAELFAALSVGLGTWDTVVTLDPDPSPAPTPTDETRLRVRWRVGPGVRYWVHPHVAMNLVTGVSGNHMIVDGPTPATSSSLGLTALYTQIGLTGVF